MNQDRLQEYAKVMKASGCTSCSLYFQVRDKEVHWTIHLDENGELCPDPMTYTPVVYCIASLTKGLLFCTLHNVVLKRQRQDHTMQYSFTDVLEMPLKDVLGYEDENGLLITVKDLIHHTAIPRLEDYLLGPDGSVFLQPEHFPELVGSALHARGQNDNADTDSREYSNANAAALGGVITYLSGESVNDEMKEFFDILGMDSTICSRAHFDKVSATRALPYIATSTTLQPLRDFSYYFEHRLLFSAMGVFSDTRDLAKFSKELQRSRIPSPILPSLKKYLVGDIEGWESSHTPLGQRLTLLDLLDVKHLHDPFSPPAWTMPSLFKPSRFSNLEDTRVFFSDGSAPGYTCAWYNMPDLEASFGVLCNSSGRINTPAHIGRLLLAELLERQDLGLPQALHRDFKSLGLRPAAISLHALGATATAVQALREIENPTPISAEWRLEPRLFQGLYFHEPYQELRIRVEGDELVACLAGGESTTEDFRLVQIEENGQHLLVACPWAGDNAAILTYDYSVGMYNRFKMTFEREGEEVVAVTRIRDEGHFHATYQRVLGA